MYHLRSRVERSIMEDNSLAAYCFRKANFDSIREYLYNNDFDQMLSIVDIDEMLDEFYTLIYEIYERFVPKATIKPSSNPTWFNKQLCNSKNARNRQYKKLCAARKLDENADASKYVRLSDEFEKRKSETYDGFIHDLALNSKNEPRKFWKFISGNRKSNSLPCKLTHNDNIATSDIDKANLFADFFASVFIERPADNELKKR